MRTNHQRIFTRGGSNNPVAGSLEIERKQFKDMRFVIDGQNQFICHVRFLFLSLYIGLSAGRIAVRFTRFKIGQKFVQLVAEGLNIPELTIDRCKTNISDLIERF